MVNLPVSVRNRVPAAYHETKRLFGLGYMIACDTFHQLCCTLTR
jgi:hypothetical protein